MRRYLWLPVLFVMLQLLVALAALVTVLDALGRLFNLVRVQLAAGAVGDVVLALRKDTFRELLGGDDLGHRRAEC